MDRVDPPLSLLAELTYRCNLRCPYCYNPVARRSASELDVETWLDIIAQAAGMGVLQLHISGGEPTLRPNDVVSMVRAARDADLYVNLITQGTFLDEALLRRLVDAGLDHLQISIQAAEATNADRIAGAAVHHKKLAAIERALREEIAFTLNCVLHRENIETVPDVIAFAERRGVRRLELAHVQFYGWGFLNRRALLPSKAQVDAADAAVQAAQRRLRGIMEISYVAADYFGEFPKPCMNGWGRVMLTVAPDGTVLPCPAAASIDTLHFDRIGERTLEEIWYRSTAFSAYRGTAWMPSPCRDCERRELDWGGCRCQAFLVTGNAGNTDPACSLSPHRGMLAEASSTPSSWTYRRN